MGKWGLPSSGPRWWEALQQCYARSMHKFQTIRLDSIYIYIYMWDYIHTHICIYVWVYMISLYLQFAMEFSLDFCFHKFPAFRNFLNANSNPRREMDFLSLIKLIWNNSTMDPYGILNGSKIEILEIEISIEILSGSKTEEKNFSVRICSDCFRSLLFLAFFFLHSLKVKT